MKFKGTLIYSPSFKENIYKRYPLVVLLEDAKHYIPQFDYLSVQRAAIEEILILMISPHTSLEVQKHANYTILPFTRTVWNVKVAQNVQNARVAGTVKE